LATFYCELRTKTAKNFYISSKLECESLLKLTAHSVTYYRKGCTLSAWRLAVTHYRKPAYKDVFIQKENGRAPNEHELTHAYLSTRPLTARL